MRVMVNDLPPEPLVAANVDLRGMPWMPLDTQRLLDSDLFALATAEEFRAAVVLWCKAWQQVPAGSLPSDDRVLAHLSGTGARWPKVRAMALRGFVLCSDGRHYHAVIAEKVEEAWKERLRNREKQRAFRDRKAERNGCVTGDVTVTQPARDRDVTPDRDRDRDRDSKDIGSQSTKGRGQPPESDRSPTGSRLAPDWTLPDDLKAWATEARPDLDVDLQTARFRDYWAAVPGAKGRKTDWPATWRNWIRSEKQAPGTHAKPAYDWQAIARAAGYTEEEIAADASDRQ